MTTLSIIKSKLDFLVSEYCFTFEFNDVRGDHYIFKNKNGYIEFYEWPQFDESEIYVKYDMIFKTINLFLEYPKMIGEFNQNHKGFKWVLKDKRTEYWEMVSKIIQLEIANYGSIFGLKL